LPSARLRPVLFLAWAPPAVALALLLAILSAAVGVPWWAGALLGLLAGALIVWLLTRSATDRLVERLDGVRFEPGTHPHYENLVEGLCLSTGLAEPRLYVVDDESMNGAALSWAGVQALVVTSGLLASCDRIELEGVLAGLLSRIKSGDAEAATLVSALFGRTVLESGVGSIFRPVVDRASRSVFDEQREITGDRFAVSVTRYPPGLLAALQRIESGSYEPASSTPGTQHLWFAPPSSAPVVPHSSLTWRLDVLSEI